MTNDQYETVLAAIRRLERKLQLTPSKNKPREPVESRRFTSQVYLQALRYTKSNEFEKVEIRALRKHLIANSQVSYRTVMRFMSDLHRGYYRPLLYSDKEMGMVFYEAPL